MKDAGIDISTFKSQEATYSKAAGAGVATKQILEAANWSSAGPFQKFYHGNANEDKFGKSVLSSKGASNHTC